MTADENFKPEPFEVVIRSTGQRLLVPPPDHCSMFCARMNLLCRHLAKWASAAPVSAVIATVLFFTVTKRCRRRKGKIASRRACHGRA